MFKNLFASKPQLFFRNTSFNQSMVSSIPLLHAPYQPTPWIPFGHLQTIGGTMLRRFWPVQYHRELVDLHDGGQITLDWDTGTNTETGHYETEFHPSTPVVLIMPGLTGGSESRYIRQYVMRLRQSGLRAAVANYRGFNIPLKTPMVMTGCDVTDVSCLVRHVKERIDPDTQLFGFGISMGANMLTKYFGTVPESPILGAVCVSNAFNYPKLCESLERPVNRFLYSRPLATSLKRRVLGRKENLEQVRKIMDTSLLKKTRTIREVDDNFCRKCYGIETVEQYYERSSSEAHLSAVRVPMLFINSKDDPFYGSIPTQFSEDNPHLIFAVTERGGHVHFTRGLNPTRIQSCWTLEVCIEYLNSLRQKKDKDESAHAELIDESTHATATDSPGRRCKPKTTQFC